MDKQSGEGSKIAIMEGHGGQEREEARLRGGVIKEWQIAVTISV